MPKQADHAHQTWAIGSGQPELFNLPQRAIPQWEIDVEIAGIGDAAELARLPEAERAEWQALWAEVDAVLARDQAAPPKP